MRIKKLLALMLSCAVIMAWPVVSFAEQGEADNASLWASEDFTYGSYEKDLYGCDYTRQITISGTVITGFSESGEQKLETNKDLVIPATDTEGNQIVGIGSSAFQKKGLTSVTFPVGMMVDYDDTITHSVTKRGNFVIAESAFLGNELTRVTLPSGVIAVLSNAFANNHITSVTLPRTIWWIESMSFGRNDITEVNFPKITDFVMEMHGMTFAGNYIKSVRLPDTTEVVNKDAFSWNTGMEALPEDAPSKYASLTSGGRTYDNCGVVYMYTSNSNLVNKDRIHHIEKATASQHSYTQKLIVGDAPVAWTKDDFTYDGTTITGLSESGIIKRADNKNLVLPDRNPAGEYITAIAAAEPIEGGLFATADEKFDTVELPSKLVSIGDNAFRHAGIKDVLFPNTLESIGASAFQRNNLTSVVLPDSVVSLGQGAFATNAEIERIILSKSLTVIPDGAFGCSDAKHYMTKLTSINLHEGIVTIGSNAFGGNNFKEIRLPSTVKSVGDYAFSTKNYLDDECTLYLNEGLETIGMYAFRNKCIQKVQLPKSLQSMKANSFLKAYSNGADVICTKLYVPTREQFEDRTNFPENAKYHEFILLDSTEWTIDDFTFESGEDGFCKLTGLSESGKMKVELNKEVVLPYTDSEDEDGNVVSTIASGAFAGLGIEKVTIPGGVTVIEANAFKGNQLTKLQLPNGIEVVDGTAFAGNARQVKMFLDAAVTAPSGVVSNANQELVSGIMDEVPTKWDAEDFTYDEESGTITGWSDSGNRKRLQLHTLILPDKTPGGKDIVAIADSAFAIPDDEYKVLHFGIESPNGMTSVKLPANLKSIGKKAFDCNALTEVDFGSVESIGESAFHGNLLKKAILPDTLTELGAGAFANNNITEIRLSKNVTVIPQAAFSMNIRLEHIDIPDTVTEIGQMAFAGARLTELTIPKSVEKIGVKAFHLHHLTELTIPGNVKEIGESAFEGTYKATTLKKLTIDEGVESIGKYAFKEALLETVHFPRSLKNVGTQPFLNNKGKDGSHVVEVTTNNKEHKSLVDDTYQIVYKAAAIRIEGQTRYDTALESADAYKRIADVKEFDNVIVACGSNYPDALAGGYLAKVKNAPILLVAPTTETKVGAYIEANLKDGGTVYILGGEGAVSKKFEDSLQCKVERLGGSNRYDTNLEILKAADVKDEDILICTGNGYADSLSASAAGRPILLVGDKLTSAQVEYLGGLETEKAYAIGGTGVVSSKLVGEYEAVSGVSVKRLAGANRFETSVAVAKEFFSGNCKNAVLVYGQNFPDGLSGAPVAMLLDAPILLVTNTSHSAADAFCQKASVEQTYVLGGASLIADKIAAGMMSE